MDLGIVHYGGAWSKSSTDLVEMCRADRCQVKHVMKGLLSELDILLNVAGFQSIDQIDRSAIGEPWLPVLHGKIKLMIMPRIVSKELPTYV